MKLFRKKPSEGDIALFLSCNAIMSEEDLHRFLDLLRTEKAFHAEERKRLLDFLAFFAAEQERRFDDARLQRLLEALLTSLAELKVVTATHFFVFPRNQSGENLRHCLHPDYFVFGMDDISIDEHHFFIKAENQLGSAVEKVSSDYDAFRAKVRKRLRI